MDSVKCTDFECIHHEYCAGACTDCAAYGCTSCNHVLGCMSKHDHSPESVAMSPDLAEGVFVI